MAPEHQDNGKLRKEIGKSQVGVQSIRGQCVSVWEVIKTILSKCRSQCYMHHEIMLKAFVSLMDTSLG